MNKDLQNPLVAMLYQAFNGISLIHADQGVIRATLLHADASTATTIAQKKEATRECVEMNAIGARYSPEHDFAVAGGNAIIPVRGGLINRYGYAMSYLTGYNYIRNAVMAAAADPKIERIILDIDSIGGQVAGCFETADIIKEATQTKPVVAYIDSGCYSAAYAIASACSEIYATPSAGVGSIGVVATHMSVEKMLDNWGIEVTYVQAGAKKTDGTMLKKLSDTAKADIQASVDAAYDKFVQHVADCRGIDVKAVVDTQAGVFTADDALSLGLIDGIVSPSMLISTLTSQKDEPMTIAANKPDTSVDATANTATVDATAAATNAERARISSIMQSPEAAKNQSLANHIAFNTDMSVEQATAMMAASAPATTQAAPATEPATTQAAPATEPATTHAATTTPLQSAMSVTEQPNLLADKPTEASNNQNQGLLSNESLGKFLGEVK